MCNSVTCNGREYSSPRRLAALLGGLDELVWLPRDPSVRMLDGKDWRDLDLCLCHIDLEATVDRAGLHWHRGADPMEYFVD